MDEKVRNIIEKIIFNLCIFGYFVVVLGLCLKNELGSYYSFFIYLVQIIGIIGFDLTLVLYTYKKLSLFYVAFFVLAFHVQIISLFVSFVMLISYIAGAFIGIFTLFVL